LEQARKAARDPESFRLVQGDLRDGDAVTRALASFPFDAVVHLGALAGVQPSIQNPKAYVEVNVLGTANVLEAAVKCGVKAVVSASSSSVYGANKKLPFAESDPVETPISPYAATKRAAELLAFPYAHLHGMSVANLRFFTVYGPRQRPDLAIYKFTRAMLADRPITLYGDGKSSRDYTFIADCVDGVLRAVEWTLEGARAGESRYDIFNLGESETVTLSRLVELLEQNLKKKAVREYAPYLAGDVFATFADLTHARKVLGYQPKIKIEEGIRRFCEWFLKEEKDKPWAR
jgi:UDP-glucuronate 4-epimerase